MRNWIIGMMGVGLFAGVWMVAQPPPPIPFGEMQFPQFSSPPVCDAGRLSHIYYDTDDNLPYFCNGTAWTTFGITISGTNDVLAKFNDAGTNVEDSDMTNAGAPAAGVTGSIFSVSETINIMDSGDTTTGLSFTMNNANHTSGALVYGFNLTLSGGQDADATETGIVYGTGWDYAWQAIQGTARLAGAANTAGSGQSYFEFQGNLMNAMDGSDTINIIDIDPVNPNHTGANNILNAININNFSADAQATEQALRIGTGWDRDIYFLQDDHPHLYFDNSETNAVFDSADNDPSYSFKASSSTITTVNFEEGGEITHLMGTDLSLSGTTLTIDPNSNVVEVFGDGADTVSVITAPADANNTERVTFICQDADVTFNDADAAGAAGTIDLAGTATNFTCSADDTLTLAYYINPVSGNARWVEVARSVN